MNPPWPTLEFLYRTEIHVGPPLLLGATPEGERRIINIAGGSFEGPRLRGEVLPGGADWQIVRPDGSAIVEARFTLRTADGALVYVMNRGVRRGPPEVMARLARGEPVDPREYYFRMTPVYETGAPQYAWLNGIVAVASGLRLAAAVIYDVFTVA